VAESSLKQNENASSEEVYQVEAQLAGERLDFVLVHYYPDLSRSRLQSWIKNGQVKLDGLSIVKPKHKVLGGESLTVLPIHEDQGQWVATKMALHIVFEDDDLMIINKPVGLVVHPAPGHYQDTLVNGLLHAYPNLIKIPRAGIVHRLDKDTTGLLVVAKTLEAHHYLVDQLQQRLFQREYMALVHHTLVAGDSIDLPIGRHPQQRKKMAVVLNQSHAAKEAITHFRIERKYKHFTLLKVKLETGRTHQIRVHLSHINHPIVGDPLYSMRNLKPKAMSPEFSAVFESFERQALHAYSLAIVLPSTGELMQWQSELPTDFRQLLDAIEQHDRVTGS